MEISSGEGDTSPLVKDNEEPKIWVVKLLFCVLFLLGKSGIEYCRWILMLDTGRVFTWHLIREVGNILVLVRRSLRILKFQHR